MASVTNFRTLDTKFLDFGRIRPKGHFNFVPTTFKHNPLVIETPLLITPTGIQSEENRNWMDLELDVNSKKDHQELFDAIRSVDDCCIDEIVYQLDKWFADNKDIDEDFVEDNYRSPLTAGWGNEPGLLRVEIQPEAPEDLMDSNGNILSPSDVTALSSVSVKLQLLGVWVSDKYLGTHWRAISAKANLDHEVTGRRRSNTPTRAESPLPPVRQRRDRTVASTSTSTTTSAHPEPAPKQKSGKAPPTMEREHDAAPSKYAEDEHDRPHRPDVADDYSDVDDYSDADAESRHHRRSSEDRHRSGDRRRSYDDDYSDESSDDRHHRRRSDSRSHRRSSYDDDSYDSYDDDDRRHR